MAIRLIDQYPNRAGVPNADYPHGVPRNKSTPTSTDGTPFEQAWFRDQEGFFQGLLETAGIAPSGSPDTVEQSDYFDALVNAMHGVTEVDVGGAADVTLGIYPSRVAAIRLTGTLGADVDLIVPDTERLYTIIDDTTGSFSVTVRTSAGTGVTVGESVSVVRSDGTNVVSANPASDLGQNIAVFDTAGVTEWEVPAVLRAGLRKAKVTVTGAGGSGRSSNTVDIRAAAGGAGGTAIGLVDLSSVTSVSITVGNGGAGVVGTGEVGNPGGSSSFGAYLTAEGGIGGGVLNGTDGGYGGGAAGGDINIYGGSGGDSSSNGGSGHAGASYWGGGMRGGRSATPDESAYGAGSGGAGNDASSSDGAGGIVIVRW